MNSSSIRVNSSVLARSLESASCAAVAASKAVSVIFWYSMLVKSVWNFAAGGAPFAPECINFSEASTGAAATVALWILASSGASSAARCIDVSTIMLAAAEVASGPLVTSAALAAPFAQALGHVSIGQSSGSSVRGPNHFTLVRQSSALLGSSASGFT